MALFSLSAIINWQGDTVRLLRNLYSERTSHLLVGTVMNPLLNEKISITPLHLTFLLHKMGERLMPQILEVLDSVDSERDLVEALSTNTAVKKQVDKILAEDKDLMDLKKEVKESESLPLKLYYGVFDNGGLEFFCPAAYWESDDIQIRTGGHLWWLQWCKNGGRSGSSMPFSAWMTKPDAEWVTSGESGEEKQQRSEFILWLMKHSMPNQYTFAEWLWPWKQHMDYLAEQTMAEAAQRGYNKDDANELYQSKLSEYFGNRQSGEGLLAVEYDLY